MGIDNDQSNDLFFETLSISIERALTAHGIAPDAIAAAISDCVDVVRLNLGGITLYIPRGTLAKVQARNLQIWNEFNGANFQALALAHGLTVVRVRQILKDMMKKRNSRAHKPE